MYDNRTPFNFDIFSESADTAQIPDLKSTSADDIAECLRGAFQDPDYQPPVLPRVAVEVLRMSRSEYLHINQVVEVLEQDAILAGRVLRLVQSPLYAGLVPIKSLKQAVVRLGLETLREVVMTVALDMRVFKASIYRDVMVQLQHHSRATGYLSKVICRYTGVDCEFAFLCGLLHDVGIAGMLIILSEKRTKHSMPALTPLWPTIEAAHDTASGLMSQMWGMPDEITKVLGSHHNLIGAKSIDPLVATIRLAESIADEQGFGISIPGQPPTGPIDGNHRPTLETSVEYLGVNDKTLELIRKDAHLVLKTLVA